MFFFLHKQAAFGNERLEVCAYAEIFVDGGRVDNLCDWNLEAFLFCVFDYRIPKESLLSIGFNAEDGGFEQGVELVDLRVYLLRRTTLGPDLADEDAVGWVHADAYDGGAGLGFVRSLLTTSRIEEAGGEDKGAFVEADSLSGVLEQPLSKSAATNIAPTAMDKVFAGIVITLKRKNILQFTTLQDYHKYVLSRKISSGYVSLMLM